MASFQATIGWKRLRKRVNKNRRSVPFQPDALQKISKKQQKKSKNQKISLGLHFKPKQVAKGRERDKIKIIVSFPSDPTHDRKFKKMSKKIRKIKKYHYGFF